MRICFFGDSFTHDVGDEEGLGWRGRIVARLLKERPNLTAYDLGIRRDTSADISNRWEMEALVRLPQGYQHRLAFCFGTNDCADDGSGIRRVSYAETVKNTHAILARSAALAPTILIGPPPILDDPTADHRIEELEPALQSIAEQYNIPFIPMLDTLRHAPQWTQGAAAGDGTHPDRAGYAFMADCIWKWSAFSAWVDSFDNQHSS
ncbi:GDSL-type esterase/lipase family protein [Agrobacterium vitis]|uniref:GDSL-type esterase/lipase family protein n=1 Tax=Agrobacterium vitis TaxID=373 RepID=UPI000871EC32|nr:GDSL-type esterase/lipase family protein [Agrobacterium vitis]NSY12743.1 hypothetical protein [Agrobacterium vitis]NSY22500.1 hypothetical protein [Agrobacterium vitis]NTA22205.1 hypothetical protein [Agrobacterium vitis]WEO70486.1 GDSL-type esterase/lipase family protein [Agrobacterium vitis]